MATVRVNGVELGYDEAGSGPAVVLVHAALANRLMWEHQFRALAATHRVIRYDWRGYGESSEAAGEFAHHEDLLGLLDALGVARAALVGCSMGAAYSVDVALAAPERVSALALVCAGLSGHEWPPAMLERARALTIAAVPAERLSLYASRTGAPVDPADVAAGAEAQVRFMVVGPDRSPDDLDPAVWALSLEMCRGVLEREWSRPQSTERLPDPPAAGRLAEIDVPTLVVAGLADVPEVLEVSDLLTEGIAGARRVDLPTGHLPSLERPAEVTALLQEFLATV